MEPLPSLPEVSPPQKSPPAPPESPADEQAALTAPAAPPDPQASPEPQAAVPASQAEPSNQAEPAPAPVPQPLEKAPAVLPPTTRLISLDAYRGFIMLMMASSGFGFVQMAQQNPESWWPLVASQFDHRAWIGCAFWDLIQPSFMFMVGVAMAYSYAKRRQAGASFGALFGHALVRAVVLTLLGVMLSSKNRPQTEWLFTNVLSQIGLGYVFLFLLWCVNWRAQVAAVIAILVGYGWWFANFPLPGEGYDFAAVGAAPESVLPGFFGHWSIHINAAADFDRWFLNLFPRAKPWVSHAGGYQTLNFVPSLATMAMGLLAGEFLRTDRTNRRKCGVLVVAGVVLLLLGTVAGFLACPLVKRIWTPSWTLFSGGWVLLILAAFFWMVEIKGWKKWTFPLVVVGMNSIAIYLLHSLCAGWIRATLKTHFGDSLFSGYWGPIADRCSVLLVLWLFMYWLYRQRAFLRI